MINTKITQEHFFAVLKHDGHKCLCPNPKHKDLEPGSVSFTNLNSGSVGIRCFVCNENYNLYKTLELLNSKYLNSYGKFVNMKKDKLVLANKQFNANYTNTIKSNKSTLDYAENFNELLPNIVWNALIPYDSDNIFKNYNLKFDFDFSDDSNDDFSLLNSTENSDISIKTESIYKLIPFLTIPNYKIANSHLISKFIAYDNYFKTIVINYCDSKDNIINLFNHQTDLGKYVPKFKWRRELKNLSIENYYDVPIFYDYTINLKLSEDASDDFIIITEGVKDCMNALLLNYHSITTGGVKNTKPMTDIVISEIKSKYKCIVIALDNDVHGLSMIDTYKSMFSDKLIVNLTKYFDPGEDFTDFMFRKISQDKNFRLTI